MRFLVNARNRTVAVENGKLVEPRGSFDFKIDVPGADVLPGLINAHDHLHRNHYGRLGVPPYRNAYQWAAHIQDHYRQRIEARRHPRRQELLAGAWKNLFAGVTTVVHHDPWEDDFDHQFPLKVARLQSADSVGKDRGLAEIDSRSPYSLHVAEGTDSDAAEELHELDGRGLLTANLIAVHGVGLDDRGIDQFAMAGAALVWCPSSNIFLFGRTAPLRLLQSGVDVLLGSDSLLTGAGDLLDELRCARSIGSLGDSALQGAVGATPARRLGLPTPSLEHGAFADLLVVQKPLLEARADDVALVVVEGVPRVARPDLVPSLNGLAAHGERMTVGSVTRWTNMHPATEYRGREACSA